MKHETTYQTRIEEGVSVVDNGLNYDDEMETSVLAANEVDEDQLGSEEEPIEIGHLSVLDEVHTIATDDETAMFHVTAAPVEKTPEAANYLVSKTTGPTPDENTYKTVCNLLIQVSTTADGVASWRPFDTCSRMSFMSRPFFDRHYSHLTLVTKKFPAPITGIAHGAIVRSTQGVSVNVFFPMIDERPVRVNAFFHILENFKDGLLIGNDLSVHNGFEPRVTEERYTIKRCHTGKGHPVGQLRCYRREDLKSIPVRLAKTVNLQPREKRSVPITHQETLGEHLAFDGREGAKVKVQKVEGGEVTLFNSSRETQKLTKNTILGSMEGPTRFLSQTKKPHFV